ncbi:MAG TPA: putative sugar nucleotidyl transferase [Ignavibacteria bacterium]|nr:putative sugar nucleotidyl transferase [Ignavibacteria bacterium]
MNICIFEDLFISQLAPINYLRHTSKLICGADTLLEKIVNFFPAKTPLTLHSRKYIAPYLAEKFPKAKINELAEGDCIFFNSRVVFKAEELKAITKLFKKENNTAVLQDKVIIAFHLSKEKVQQYKEIVNPEDDNLISYADVEWLGLNKIDSDIYRLINYPSDLILYNEDQLNYDLNREMKGKKKLHIGKKCSIGKNVVLDTSAGRIYINDNSVIEPFTYIKGPVYIGENSTIRSGSQIYGPVRIGGSCKVSGEITCSVLHWYVNKQHYGFLGHSYLCEWTNLGAGTTTSNLKNNYSKIVLNIDDKKVNTNSIFLGSIIGDHTKTGIQTMLNTGTMVGISSNLYGAGYHNKKISSFSWEDASNNEVISYEIEKAISTARTSMNRRNVNMSDAYEKMLRHVFEKKDENLI